MCEIGSRSIGSAFAWAYGRGPKMFEAADWRMEGSRKKKKLYTYPPHTYPKLPPQTTLPTVCDFELEEKVGAPLISMARGRNRCRAFVCIIIRFAHPALCPFANIGTGAEGVRGLAAGSREAGGRPGVR